MGMTNPLARARGHGSAKEGPGHWLAQRATAVFLIFLVGWLGYAAFTLAGADFAAARAFMGHPLHAALLILLVITVLYHGMLGLQVVVEDYVHHPAAELTLHFLIRAAAYLGMALGVVNILIIALGA
jgi:succinate dehydrogenase / fumarate reductase membrane anchor subunit